MITKLRHPPTESVHLVLMLALTFATGIIDAVGYLGLDRVFTGNMTGNVVILGMALLGADGVTRLRLHDILVWLSGSLRMTHAVALGTAIAEWSGRR